MQDMTERYVSPFSTRYASDEMQALFRLPSFPLLHIGSGLSRLRAGYSFTEASSMMGRFSSTVSPFTPHASTS